MLQVLIRPIFLLLFLACGVGCKTKGIPADKDPDFLKALQAYESEEFEEAQKALDSHLKHYPEHAAGYRYAAEIHGKLSGIKLQELAKQLSQMRQQAMTSSSPPTTKDLGEFLSFFPEDSFSESLKHIAKAVGVLEIACGQIPNDGELRASLFVYKLAYFLGLTKNLLEKIDTSQKAVNNIDKFQAILGGISSGDFEKALLQFQNLMDMVDQLPTASQKLARYVLSRIQITNRKQIYNLNDLNSKEVGGLFSRIVRDQMVSYLGKNPYLQTPELQQLLTKSIDQVIFEKGNIQSIYSKSPELQRAFDPTKRQGNK